MIASIIFRNERAAESLPTVSKAAKFYSAAAEFAVKFFNGLETAAALGLVSTPLKKFVEAVDVLNLIDILNGPIVDRNNWVKTASKVAIIAALVISPIVFASTTLGLFSLGVFGANIALYGTMTLNSAVSRGLALSSTLLGMYDRYRTRSTEAEDERFAKAQFKQFKILNELNAPTPIPVNEAEVRFKRAARKVGMAANVINQQWIALTTNPQAVGANYLATMTEFRKLQHEEKALKNTKAQLAWKDDWFKVATTAVAFAGAFLCPPLTGMIAVSALALYSAHLGWEKADLDLLITKKSVELHNYSVQNAAIINSVQL